MKVLIDTNVLLDFYAKREDYFNDANDLLNTLIDKNCTIYVAAYSIPTIGYVLRKNFKLDEIKNITNDILTICNIVPLNRLAIVNANDSNISDYEDTFMEASALLYNIDYIVTRNISDFVKSRVKVISPNDMIKLLV